MKKFIEIPFIKSPKSSLNVIKSIVVEGKKLGELWDDGIKTNISPSTYNRDFLGIMYAWEIEGYFPGYGFKSKIKKHKKNNLEDEYTTIIVFDESDERTARIFAYILLLSTGHWTYVRDKTESMANPKGPTGVINRPRPVIWQLTHSKISRLIKMMQSICDKRERSFSVSCHIWFTALTRENNVDILRDCISSLEGILETTGSLNIAFKARYYLDDSKVFKFIYKMNNLRNDYVHGKKIPNLDKDDINLLIKYNYLCLKKYSEGVRVKSMHEIVDNF